jgi:predicted ABC-type ATPase
VIKAQNQGYSVTLLFFWLNNIELAKERVKVRVQEGGHHIPNDVIERRYLKGIKNLFDIYIDLVDGTFIFDNSNGKHELIAQKIEKEDILLFDLDKFKQLKNYYDKKG